MSTTKLTSDETADLCGALIPILVRRSSAEFDLSQMASSFGAFCHAYGVEVDLDTVLALAWEANLSLWQRTTWSLPGAMRKTGTHAGFQRSRAGERVRRTSGGKHTLGR